MSAPPYMPLYVADYLGDTRHLSTEQHGAYLLILMAMWRAGGRLPNEAVKLARIAGLTPARWAKLETDILELFDVLDDHIGHKRIEKEFEKFTRISAQRSAAGQLGGKAKSLKNNDPHVAVASDLPTQNGAISDISISIREEKSLSPYGDVSLLPAVPDAVETAFAAYNSMARHNGLTVAAKLTPKRRTALAKRIAEVGADGWGQALDSVPRSAFLLGSTGWRADLDFLLQPSSLQKVLEGSYEDKPNGRGSPAPGPHGRKIDALQSGLMEASRRARRWSGVDPAD